ncbi:peptidoglycan recognition protein family protein [Planctomicrobium sp. SH668]|uniref:peptidoglycan recognition protein family protein n=1 Tax=Planctomicrobium sp. SH668 TaxID=3448126 RepID=UPI003F5B3C87
MSIRPVLVVFAIGSSICWGSPPSVVAVQKSRFETVTEQPSKIELVTATREDVDLRPWKFIVLHHSASASGSVKQIHEEHLRRKDADGNPWRGIGYHFVIGNGQGMGDGELQSTFRWTEQQNGAHAGVQQFNEYGIGICLIGDFEKQAPTRRQVQTAQELILRLQQHFQISNDQVLRHGELKATACPGARMQTEMFITDLLPSSVD